MTEELNKTYYTYSGVTHEFLTEDEGYTTELEPDVVIIPANATRIAPPSTGANQVAVFDPDEETWAVLQDHRGEVRYLKTDGSISVVTEIGPVSPDTVDQPRPDATYVWNQNQNAWVIHPALQAAANNAILYADMSVIDLQSIAPIREWLAAQPGAPSAVTTLETQYQAKKAALDLSYED